MLFGPGCGLSPITVRRPMWRRWSARVVGCGCATAVVIGKQQARPRRGIVQMAGNASLWSNQSVLLLILRSYELISRAGFQVVLPGEMVFSLSMLCRWPSSGKLPWLFYFDLVQIELNC